LNGKYQLLVYYEDNNRLVGNMNKLLITNKSSKKLKNWSSAQPG